jgi:hypothetical protein
LHQCIRPLIGAFAPGHHGYQRACVLISGQASIGPFGSPVFACAGKTEPPSRLILSQTSAGNFDRITSSLAPHIAQFLCSTRAVPSSRPADRRSRRAQGRSRPAVALGLRRGSGVARLRLDPRRARREDQAGRTPASSVLVSSKARPLASTAQAMRASLLASAIASTLWCNRLLAASIQDLSP